MGLNLQRLKMKILKESDKAIVKSTEQKIKNIMEVAIKGEEEKT